MDQFFQWYRLFDGSNAWSAVPNHWNKRMGPSSSAPPRSERRGDEDYSPTFHRKENHIMKKIIYPLLAILFIGVKVLKGDESPFGH